MNSKIKTILENLPDKPGVYLMKNSENIVIYVGKATNLKNRVRSYFNNISKHDIKTESLVENIDDIEYIITSNEHEALILENTLIKKHKPRYNIMFKDDKTYPFIKLTTNESWPKLLISRKIEKDNCEYYGPFSDQSSARVIIKLAQDIFHIRSCKYNLTKPRKKACLQYYINRCFAPCIRNISEEKYIEVVESVRNFLLGKYKPIIDELTFKMKEYAQNFKFEQAAIIRDQINAINNLSKKQNIISFDLLSKDIIIDVSNNYFTLIGIFLIRNGVLIGNNYFVIENDKIPQVSILDDFIQQYYTTTEHTFPDEIITLNSVKNETINLIENIFKPKCVKFYNALNYKNTDIITIAHQNTLNTLKLKEKEMESKNIKINIALNELKEALNLKTIPYRIECFDISNISGMLAVGSMSVAINGRLEKSEYRKFKIKTVTQIDDYKMMQEVLRRRLNRAISENQQFADLIVIDGGIGHLSAACEVLSELNLNSKIAICSIAKQNEDIFVPLNHKPIALDKKSEGQYLLMRIRDEAHRFAISYHKKLRNKKLTLSILSDIKGLGKKRIALLYEHFETIDRIRNASINELMLVKGITKPLAYKIYEFFNQNQQDKLDIEIDN